MRKMYMVMIIVFSVLFLHMTTYKAEIKLNIYGKGGAGEWDNPILTAEHPEISWTGGDDLNGGVQDLVQSLTARQPYDIYAINYTDQNFTEVINKGYATDLTVYPILKEYAFRFRPYIQKALIKDDKMYGVPIQVSTSMLAYSPKAFARVGLNEDDVPTTYEEFLNLLLWWIAEEPDTQVQFIYGAGNLRVELANIITKTLIERYNNMEDPEPFTSDPIAAIYKKLDEADTTKIDKYLASLEEGEGYSQSTLFSVGFDALEIRNYEEYADFNPINLLVKEKETKYVPVSMRIFFISKDSENPDAAALYLEAYLRGLDESFTIKTEIGPHNPVHNLRVEKEIEIIEAEIEKLEAERLKDHGDLEQQIKQNIQLLERMEKQRWLVPKDNIERFEVLQKSFQVPAYSPLGSIQSEGYRSLQMLIDQYAARQISVETFLRGIDQKLDMIKMESE